MQTPSRGAPGRPLYTWMDDRWGHAGPQATAAENDRSWRWTGICGGGGQPVLALSVLIDTGLLSFSFSHQVFSSSSFTVF